MPRTVYIILGRSGTLGRQHYCYRKSASAWAEVGERVLTFREVLPPKRAAIARKRKAN